MSSRILLLPGDGIGLEVVREARRVLEVVDDQFSLELSFSEGRLGGTAIDEEGAAYPDAKFVHIVRHPLNVVSSLRAGKVMGPHTLQAGINTWSEAVSIAAKFQSAWPDRIHTLTYENLTTSPKLALHTLLDFLGEAATSNPFDVSQVHPEKNLHEEQLSESERVMIREQLAAEMTYYGYV